MLCAVVVLFCVCQIQRIWGCFVNGGLGLGLDFALFSVGYSRKTLPPFCFLCIKKNVEQSVRSDSCNQTLYEVGKIFLLTCLPWLWWTELGNNRIEISCFLFCVFAFVFNMVFVLDFNSC